MIQTRILCRALCAVVAVVLSTGRPTAAAENLLVNPGFETVLKDHPWMPAGWDTTEAGLPTVFFSRDTSLAHGGRYAISVASASGHWAIEHGWSQSLIVGPKHWGKDFVLTIWTRSIGVEGRPYVALQALRDTVGMMAIQWKMDREAVEHRLGVKRIDVPIYDLGWQRVVMPEPETDWVKRELRVFVPPRTHLVTVRAGVLGVGQLFLDDASLTAETARPAVRPEPGVNLIVDPSFEGDFREWEISRPPYPNLEAAPSDQARTGARSIRFSGGGGLVRGRAGVAQAVCNRALAGQRLRLVGHAKADSLGSSATARLFCHTPRGIFQDVSAASVSGTADWTELAVEMDAPPDTYAVWAWLSYAAPAKGVVYFDDLSLQTAGAARTGGATGDGKP